MINPILSQSTMEAIEDSLLSEGKSLRVHRNKKQQITRIAVLGLSKRCFRKHPLDNNAEPKIVEVEVYKWRPNHV